MTVEKMDYAARSQDGVLNSWKEIAAFVGRGVRTVQRWEREFGFPVHRVGDGRGSVVFAFRGELQDWLSGIGKLHQAERSFCSTTGDPRGEPGC